MSISNSRFWWSVGPLHQKNRAVGPAPLVTNLIPGWDFEDQLHGNA
jgi:hypothetical protein